MKTISFAWRAFLRQIQSGEVIVLIAAVTMAVASLTAVGLLTDRISTSIERQAGELLAADLRIRSPDPIPSLWIETATDMNLDVAQSQTFPTVVYSGANNALATIKAVSSKYPLRGKVKISDRQFGDEYAVSTIPSIDEVWVDDALLFRLKANVGDVVAIGNTDFKVTALLRYRPDQSIGFASLSPTILINFRALPDTGLITEGSRVNYSLLAAGDEDVIERFAKLMGEMTTESARISDPSDSSQRTNQAINRAQQFLSFTVIISVLLSSIAIAMSARRFMKKRMDMVALMKSLGAKKKFIVNTIILQLFMIGLAGVFFGCFLGFLIENTISNMLSGLFAGALPDPSYQALVIGFLAAFILLPGFAFSPLLQLSNTSPLRVLRRNKMPSAPSEVIVAGIAMISFALLLFYFVRDILLLTIIIFGMSLISILLYLVGRLLAFFLGQLRGGVGAAWRYGLANVSRRGRDSAIQIVAFGLALTALLLLSFVRTDLLDEWQKALDENTPNYFLINIQSNQRTGIKNIIEKHNFDAPEFVPLIRSRLSLINGETVKSRTYPDERGRWLANREANLSWSNTMNSSNKILEGSWWERGYTGPPLVSIEESAAKDMGVNLGDNLTFMVAGEQIDATVSSIRQVDWNSFNPNFFMVFSSNALESFPSTFIASMHLDNNERLVLTELQKNYPTVSVVDLEPILQQVEQIIEKVSMAIQTVFIFTLAAGIVVLFSAVHSSIDERRFESALLRAIGMKKGKVLSGLLSEFSAIGLAAGLLAASGSSILAWQIASRLFDINYVFSFSLWTIGLIGGVSLVCISGYLASRRAIKSSPITVLRNH